MCFAVDEEDEYECVTVLNSHTQDVKHAVWHPTREVCRSPPTGQELYIYFIDFIEQLYHSNNKTTTKNTRQQFRTKK